MLNVPERYELPPARLARWLERWVAEHGPVAAARVEGDAVVLVAADGASVSCEPPFGVPEAASAEALLAWVERPRVVGVLLVRLGGYAAGVFEGARLVDSKVGSRLVHGRHRAGGSSQRRFARRRDEQARAALGAAADVAARILLPWAGRLDAVVLGGDRRGVETVIADPRLEPLRALVAPRVLDVPDPRLAVLREMPERFLATIVRPG